MTNPLEQNVCKARMRGDACFKRCLVATRLYNGCKQDVQKLRKEDQRHSCKQTIKVLFGGSHCVNAPKGCVYLLVEFQVKDEGCAEGLHQETALGQMDGLGEERRETWEKEVIKFVNEKARA